MAFGVFFVLQTGIVASETFIARIATGCHFCLLSSTYWQEFCVLDFMSSHKRRKERATKPDCFDTPLELKAYETDAS